MKATCHLRFIFTDGSSEQEVDVCGTASLPGLLPALPNGITFELWPVDGVGRYYQVQEVRYEARDGIWTPHIRFEDVDCYQDSWEEHLDHMKHVLLPGYNLYWSGYGERPMDWVPETFINFIKA